MISVQYSGIEEIRKMIVGLEQKEIAKIARQTTREIQKTVMLPAYKKYAKIMVGGKMGALIAENLIVRAMTKMKRGNYGYKVALPEDLGVFFTEGSSFDINTKKQLSGKRYYIPAAIEYGHAFPGRGGKKNSPKDVPASPFAKTAYEANSESIIKQTIDLLKVNIFNYIKETRTSRGA
jgi:hypothetical protein